VIDEPIPLVPALNDVFGGSKELHSKKKQSKKILNLVSILYSVVLWVLSCCCFTYHMLYY